METTNIEDFFAMTNLNLTDERSFLLQLSGSWKSSISIAIAASLVIGWIAKALIFFHIFKTKITEQPINALIFIDQVSISSTSVLNSCSQKAISFEKCT
jgi:hypothetical protein